MCNFHIICSLGQLERVVRRYSYTTAAQYLVFIVNFQWPRKQITKTQPGKGWKKARIASFLGIPGQGRGLGQHACFFQVCVCTNPDSCFRCCPWLASQPFIPFSFQTHLLCLFLPRTDRSHLPIDVTSFHAFSPNPPMHPCRMGSVLQSLQDFCFEFYLLQKAAKSLRSGCPGQLGFLGVPTHLQDHSLL